MSRRPRSAVDPGIATDDWPELAVRGQAGNDLDADETHLERSIAVLEANRARERGLGEGRPRRMELPLS